MNRRQTRRKALWTALLGVASLILPPRPVAAQRPALAVIKTDVQTRLSNGGWKYDRYNDLQSLDAHRRMTVAYSNPKCFTKNGSTRRIVISQSGSLLNQACGLSG